MIVEPIKIDGTDSLRTLKSLRQELKATREQLLNLEQGTEEYNAALKKAGNLQHELKEQMVEINANADDFGQKLGNCTKVINGMMGAITATTGALSLLGVENDEAAKKITATMTSLLGIIQGLEKIDNGVKAFHRLNLSIGSGTKSMKLFRGALISTGLGALVVVLGSVVANWDEFTEAIGLSSEAMEKLGNIAGGVINVIKEGSAGIAKGLAKMVTGDFKGAWAELKDGFNIAQNYADGVASTIKKREEEATKVAKEEADKRAKAAEEAYQKRIAAAQKAAKYELEMEKAKYRGKDDYKYTDEGLAAQKKYFDTLLKIYRKDSDEYKELVLEKEQWEQELYNHNRSLQEKADADADAADKKRLDKLASFYESIKSDEQKLIDKKNELLEAAKDNAQARLDIEAWFQTEYAKLKDKEIEKDEEVNEYQKLLASEQYKSSVAIASSITTVFDALADSMEEGSAQQKALQISSTIINTLMGATGAFMQAMATLPPPYGAIVGAAQAAAATATGIAQIAKMKQVSVGDGSSSVAVPSINMNSVMGAQNVDYTAAVSGANTTSAIQDQRVYVTEHDITSTQNKVRVAENNARY